nr:phospholipase D-like domain-containing protein [Halomonas socia]
MSFTETEASPAEGASGTQRRSPDYYRTEMEYTLGSHFVDGNRVEVLRNGVEIFPAMLEAIEQAQHSIELVTFVYWTGDIARRFGYVLSRRAEEGLRVRVVLDSIGAKKMSRELIDHMSQAGVEIRWFRPLKLWRPWRFDKRTHRKILVCDDCIGFTGGVGIAEEWEGDARHPGEWRETHVRVEGPAVIGLYAAFLDNWNECGEWRWEAIRERVLPHQDGVPIQFVRASSTIGWTESAAMMRSLVSVSHVRLRIVTAYFAPDETLVQTMLGALARGVEVEILVPGKYNDSRISQLAGQPSVERLLAAGAKVWVFAPTMLHAKLAIVDDLLACIGSVNVNHRSMGKDEECSALMLSEGVAATLNRQFDEDCQRSERLSAEGFQQRSTWTRCKERAARLLLEQV